MITNTLNSLLAQLNREREFSKSEINEIFSYHNIPLYVLDWMVRNKRIKKAGSKYIRTYQYTHEDIVFICFEIINKKITIKAPSINKIPISTAIAITHLKREGFIIQKRVSQLREY